MEGKSSVEKCLSHCFNVTNVADLENEVDYSDSTRRGKIHM